jgi:hypothetical protein
MANLKLGDRAKDKISGFKGIVNGVTEWLHGSDRIILQPEGLFEGLPLENRCFDREQVTLVKANIIKDAIQIKQLDIERGDVIKDKITGIKGVVIAITHWLYGCDRLLVQSEEVKDGKPTEPFNLDVKQVELVKKQRIKVEVPEPPKPRTGGPQNDKAACRRD